MPHSAHTSSPRLLHRGFSASISGKLGIHALVRYSRPCRPRFEAAGRETHVRALAAPFSKDRRTVPRRRLSSA
ncbi:hypothetical protein HMPREF0972_00627 [Actinomyces sp. oral taxon 848 str. F0332]|nr:hypothetical protein HMPREF0972_00627 [Actinomyces sp. oral taxon 848 str. F0332]